MMMHVITGGSGSGKSAYAEGWLINHKRKGVPLYIATMQPYGREAEEKIRRHHKLRAGKGFRTLERYTDLDTLEIPGNGGILLECGSNLVANEFFGQDGARKDISEILDKVLRGIRNLASHTETLAVVTNDIHSEADLYGEETERYRELLGLVNQRIARMADRVTEVVAGVPMRIKDERNKCHNNTKEERSMILIVGGAYQGKRAFAEGMYPDIEWIDGELCSEEELLCCRGVFHFHSYIRRMMEEGKDITDLAEKLIERNPDMVVVSDEIGCGIIPVEAFQREYREQTGRTCIKIATAASRVYRVVCGIGTVIKES